MKQIKIISLFLILGLVIHAQGKDASKIDLSTKKQKISYVIGNNVGRNFISQELDLSLPEFVQGIKDGINGVSQLPDSVIAVVVNEFQQEMAAKQQEKLAKEGASNKEEGEKFLEENKTKEGVITTDSGLQYKIITKGDGKQAYKDDRVTVHYRGYFINGDEFDSSYKRNQPATFAVTGVIPGWTEALQHMNVGDKFELYIPYNLAYGEQGSPPTIPPYKTLLFEVELIDVVE